MKILNKDSNMLVLQVFFRDKHPEVFWKYAANLHENNHAEMWFQIGPISRNLLSPWKFLVPRLPVAGALLHSKVTCKYALQVFKTAPEGTIDTRRIN